jgi:hypothetical protein
VDIRAVVEETAEGVEGTGPSPVEPAVPAETAVCRKKAAEEAVRGIAAQQGTERRTSTPFPRE